MNTYNFDGEEYTYDEVLDGEILHKQYVGFPFEKERWLWTIDYCGLMVTVDVIAQTIMEIKQMPNKHTDIYE